MSNKTKKKEVQLNEFSYHEAIDRCYIITTQIETILLEHPVIQKHKKIKKNVNEAIILLTDAYQMIGNLNLTNSEEKNNKPE